MDFDRILTGADEGFDLEVLLEHLKEAFDLPAEFIDVADGLGILIKVIHQQNQRLGVLNIANNHRSQSLRIFFTGTAKIDDFIAQNIARILFQVKIQRSVSRVTFEAGNKINAAQIPFVVIHCVPAATLLFRK